jgi:hypothetical protein
MGTYVTMQDYVTKTMISGNIEKKFQIFLHNVEPLSYLTLYKTKIDHLLFPPPNPFVPVFCQGYLLVGSRFCGHRRSYLPCRTQPWVSCTPIIDIERAPLCTRGTASHIQYHPQSLSGPVVQRMDDDGLCYFQVCFFFPSATLLQLKSFYTSDFAAIYIPV